MATRDTLILIVALIGGFGISGLLLKLLQGEFNAIMRSNEKGEKSMKNRIESLPGIGKNARKITTEIGGNYAICVSTEAAKKKKYLCVYESAKGLSFDKGAVHSRKLVKAFPYSSEEGYVNAYKAALKHIAVLEHKIEA